MSSLLRILALTASVWVAAESVPCADAQAPVAAPEEKHGVTFSTSMRTRTEVWDWFEGAANNQYAFQGSYIRVSLTESTPKFDWQLEMALPILLGLPGGATAPGAQGQLGSGATYYLANHSTNAVMLFPKQGFIRFKNLGGVAGQSLKIGRMEFIDGAEVTPKDATLAAVKRERVNHRLLGNVGFSHVGRNFDGVQYGLTRGKLNFTWFGGRPDRGVNQVDGWGELNSNVFYAGLTGQAGKANAGEWRVFALGYSDYRDHVVKTDNRPAAVRSADAGHINIGTYGGHYLQTVQSSAGTFDFMLWGVLQNGSWGALEQRSGALAAEAGWQPKVLRALKPWIRGGYNYGSGDGNPSDWKHGTFFPVLLTPRIYARFSFFNAMNSHDRFGELILRPGRGITIRTDLRALRLANANDLWYSGGGMYQPWTFGYTGRPSNGHTSLGTLYDISADYVINPHVTFGAYYGHAWGKEVIKSVYPNGPDANFGFVELQFRR